MNAKAVAARDARIDCMGSHLGGSPLFVSGGSGAVWRSNALPLPPGSCERRSTSCEVLRRPLARACAADPSVWRSQSMQKSPRGSEYQQRHAFTQRRISCVWFDLYRTIDASDTLRAP